MTHTLHPRLAAAASVLLLLAVTLVLYYPLSGYDFLSYDDDVYILDDPAIQEINWRNLKTIFLEPYVATWYPLARLSAALDIFFFGHQSFGHHLVNIVLHFLNATLLFFLMNRIGQQLLSSRQSTDSPLVPALALSLLFIVHPQHVEAVSWLVQRKELLATLFSLGAILCYLNGRLWICNLLLALAMLSKPTAIVVPAFLLLLTLVLLEPGKASLSRFLQRCRALLWPGLLSLAMAALVLLNHRDAVWLNEHIAMTTRAAIYADNALQGISRFFTLHPAAFHEPIGDHVLSLSAWSIASVAVLLLLFSISVILVFGRPASTRLAASGFIFYCAALVPTGGIILFGNYAFGDRYLYLGSVGLYFLVLAGLLELHARHNNPGARQLTRVAFMLWLCLATLVSYQTLPRWASTFELWQHSLVKHPESVIANYQLGLLYFEDGDYPQALNHFALATASPSETFRVSTRVASSLYMAEIFCAEGQEDAAIKAVATIPESGGDLARIDDFLLSLRLQGYASCSRKIRSWRDALLNAGSG